MRQTHPGAWWLWALGLATAATRTTNPLLLLLVVAVAGTVVATRRTEAPWARSYAVFLRIAIIVLVIRVVFGVLFGAEIPGDTVFTLPSADLPDWMAGLQLGGPVTAEGLTLTLYDGLRLATVLVCLGAANALASPARLLKSAPGALYEAGVAVVVAMTFAPQLVTHVRRVRAARRLRGRPDRGIRGLRGMAMPVLEGALERSVELAAAMDTRGYGRTAPVSAAVRRTTGALTLTGLLAVCAGLYGLLDIESHTVLGSPLLVLGLVSAAAGLRLSGRRCPRTRYRPDPWGVSEWLVTLSGAAAAVSVIFGPGTHPAPGTMPPLPLLSLTGILLALLPAVSVELRRVAVNAPAQSATRRNSTKAGGAE